MSPRVWHPFTQLRGFQPLGTVVRGEGPWLFTDDGRRLLDGISSWWVALHGHAHPVITAALHEQASRLHQVILADFAHPPAVALTEALAAALPAGLDHVFFSDDGSTAVEVALKMAWQAQRVRDPRRSRFVAFEGGYHGDTLGAMSVGARDVFSERFRPLLHDVHFLPWGDAHAAATWLDEHGAEVVAVIIEPMIQGAGGMRFAPPEFLRAVADATRAAGALFIADEIAVGFGRTGRMWACEHADVVPDLVTLSKSLTGGALPMGVTATHQGVYDTFLGASKREAFLHGHSYTGNPLGCAAALASLRLMAEDDTLGRIRRHDQLYARWAPRFAALPGVADVRHLGSFFAFDLVGGESGYLNPVGVRLQARCLQDGLYVRPLGNVPYLLPPAVTPDDALEQALDTLLRATAELVGAR